MSDSVVSPSLARLLAAYPVAGEIDGALIAIWRGLAIDDRRLAAERLPAYLAVLAGAGRRHVPPLRAYLQQRPWRHLAVTPGASPAQDRSAPQAAPAPAAPVQS